MGVMYRRCTASVYALRYPERQLLIRPFLRESPGAEARGFFVFPSVTWITERRGIPR